MTHRLVAMLLCCLSWPSLAIQASLGLHTGSSSDIDDGHWQQISASASQRWQHWRLKLSSGWLRRQQDSEATQGLADTWLSAKYWLPAAMAGHRWQFRVRHKFATADENKALGSGGSDDELRIRALRPLGAYWLWYQGGYRWRQSSAVYHMQDGAIWGLGLHKKPYSLMYNGRQASQPGQSMRHQLMLAWQLQRRDHKITPYAQIGNRSTAALGVTLSF
ncbi:hypothetical protein [Bacterioplanes sanyensis]|nr:hypothetical protein [Bacterioplanes sanyensis]